MSEAKDLTEIRQQIQLRSAEQKLTQRSTMSVPEMRKLLGLKKTDSYWLFHKNLFKTQIIGGMMRIDLTIFQNFSYKDRRNGFQKQVFFVKQCHYESNSNLPVYSMATISYVKRV